MPNQEGTNLALSSKKIIRSKKAAAGLALITLSGFVPQPYIQSVEAASASLSVTGSFITGVIVVVGGSVKIGQVVATDINGSLTINVLGVVNPSKALTAGGAPQEGSFAITFVDTGPNVDITVSNMGAVVLAPSVGGVGPTGTVKINKVILDNFATAPVSLTDGGGGTDTATNIDVTTATGTLNLGVQLTWGAVQPIGSFAHAIVMTISF